jgi:hypothetical protein
MTIFKRVGTALFLCASLGACASAKAPAKSAETSGAAEDAAAEDEGDAADAAPGYAQPALTPAQQPADNGVSSGDKDLDTIEDAERALADDLQALDTAFSETTALSVGSNGCNRVCRAIGSMRRSVDAICRLAGDEDDRCKRARDAVERNNKRVADSGCGC